MRSALVAAMIGGCSFHPGAAPSGDDDNTTPADAPMVTGADAASIDGPGTGRVACSQDPTGVVACYEFDDNFADGTLLDSSPAHHDATTAGLVKMMRGTSPAATVGSQAKTYAPQTTDFDLKNAYSIAMWIHPHTCPDVGGADGLVDHEGQYALGIVNSFDDGQLEIRCINTNQDYVYIPMTTSSSWSLVACTWDGNDLCAHRFTSTSNKESFCTGAIAPASTGSHGLAVGHFSDQGQPVNRFDGDLDSLQIYSRALSRAAVCAIAAQPADCFEQ